MAIKKLAAALLAAVAVGGAGEGYARPRAAAIAQPAPPTAADWRTPDPQNVLVIDTNRGRILVELTPDVAPQAAARLRDLAKAGFYDGQTFFRVIDNFMDQTGDPTNTGTGGSSQANLPAEFTFRRSALTPLTVIGKANGLESGFVGVTPVIGQTLDLAVITADHRVSAWPTFCAGVVGLARADDPASANSQFFLMRADNQNLDQKYTAAGRVIAGMDVVRAIKTGEPVEAPQDRMLTVRVLADMPPADRPRVKVIDPAGPSFAATVARVRAEKANTFSICDIIFPVDLK